MGEGRTNYSCLPERGWRQQHISIVRGEIDVKREDNGWGVVIAGEDTSRDGRSEVIYLRME